MEAQFRINKRLVFDTLAKYSDTFAAFCELLTNSLQAKAKKVKIQVDWVSEENLMAPSVIDKIIVFDNGHGVQRSEFNWKILEIATTAKEGGKGIGRFAPLQMAGQIHIETVALELITKKWNKSEVLIDTNTWKSDSLDEIKLEVHYTDLEGDQKPYYKVTISDFYGPEITKKEKRRRVHLNLTEPQINSAIFAAYPEQIVTGAVEFSVNGKPIVASDYMVGGIEKRTTEFTTLEGETFPLELQFFQVKSTGKQRVFLRVTNESIKTVAGVLDYSFDCPDANQWFVLVDSPYFDENTDVFRNLSIADVIPSAQHLVTEIKRHLDTFFAAKYEQYVDFTRKLKADPYYPYRTKAASSQTRNVVFDQLAYYVEEKHHLLTNKVGIRELVYALMDKAMDSREFEFLLSQAIKLDEESLVKFRSLLERADLDDIIAFSEEVARKQQILDFLHTLNYGEISKHVKERKELHKIVERHLWLFGEQYSGKPRLFSDKNLENSLTALRSEFFAYEPAPADENLNGNVDDACKDIADLFFFNENIVDAQVREIMVIELKAPKVRISDKELTQARRYAFEIESRGVFPKGHQYKIFLIGAQVTPRAKSQGGINGNPYLFYKPSNTPLNIECFVIEWSDLVGRCKQKLSFMGNALSTKDKSVKEMIEDEFKDVNLSTLKSSLKNSGEEAKPKAQKSPKKTGRPVEFKREAL